MLAARLSRWQLRAECAQNVIDAMLVLSSDQEDEDEDSDESSVVASGKQRGRSSQGASKKVGRGGL